MVGVEVGYVTPALGDRLAVVLDAGSAHEDLIMSYALTGQAPAERSRRRGSEDPAPIA